MTSRRIQGLIAVVLAGLVALVVALATGSDEPEPPEPGPATSAPEVVDEPPAGDESPEEQNGRPDPDPDPEPDEVPEGPSGERPSSDPERSAAAAVRAYVQSLNRRDGGRVCSLFAPGALEQIDFPKERADCASTIRASLGYRDPRGLPVWQSSETTDAISAQVTGDTARVVATIYTLYKGAREPSIEDDIVYLQRSGERWLIAKASATIYRAIGAADVPPSVLRPPD